MRADAMLEKGDLEGQAVWKRIVRAVEELAIRCADTAAPERIPHQGHGAAKSGMRGFSFSEKRGGVCP